MVPKVLEFYETRHCISAVKVSEETANLGGVSVCSLHREQTETLPEFCTLCLRPAVHPGAHATRWQRSL